MKRRRDPTPPVKTPKTPQEKANALEEQTLYVLHKKHGFVPLALLARMIGAWMIAARTVIEEFTPADKRAPTLQRLSALVCADLTKRGGDWLVQEIQPYFAAEEEP